MSKCKHPKESRVWENGVLYCRVEGCNQVLGEDATLRKPSGLFAKPEPPCSLKTGCASAGVDCTEKGKNDRKEECYEEKITEEPAILSEQVNLDLGESGTGAMSEDTSAGSATNEVEKPEEPQIIDYKTPNEHGVYVTEDCEILVFDFPASYKLSIKVFVVKGADLQWHSSYEMVADLQTSAGLPSDKTSFPTRQDAINDVVTQLLARIQSLRFTDAQQKKAEKILLAVVITPETEPVNTETIETEPETPEDKTDVSACIPETIQTVSAGGHKIFTKALPVEISEEELAVHGAEMARLIAVWTKAKLDKKTYDKASKKLIDDTEEKYVALAEIVEAATEEREVACYTEYDSPHGEKITYRCDTGAEVERANMELLDYEKDPNYQAEKSIENVNQAFQNGAPELASDVEPVEQPVTQSRVPTEVETTVTGQIREFCANLMCGHNDATQPDGCKADHEGYSITSCKDHVIEEPGKDEQPADISTGEDAI